jgi:flagellar biosynthesis protein FliR
MMDELAILSRISGDLLWHGAVVFLRIGGVMMVLPGFGEQSVPVRVKLALTFVFTLVVAAARPVTMNTGALGLADFLPFIATEPIIGLALGLGFRLFVMALQTAGVMAAQALSLSQILGGAGIDPMPAVGQVLVVAGLALAMMSGFHVQAARAMILSYDVMPAGVFPRASDLTSWGLGNITASFALAFSLAAPFLIFAILYNLTLGVINRAMPQLMVAFVGAPVVAFGALFLLMLLAPVMLSVWLQALQGFATTPFQSP